jgi:GrpB-like predicted nucleotidyltransferase (UPF0157 family)
MRINILPYDENWAREFNRLKVELSIILGDFQPCIEHIGSTSVPGLASKNVIDILVGLENINQFDFITKKLKQNDRYIYYKAFEESLPNRRLFVRLRDGVSSSKFEKVFYHQEKIPHDEVNQCRIANVHVVEKESSEWLRHIAFREYLKSHESARLEYAKIKSALSQRNWKHGMEYNREKDSFIKKEEKMAVEWYLSGKK